MTALRSMHKAASAFGACCALLVLAAISTGAWGQPDADANARERFIPNSVCQGGYVHEVAGLASIQRQSAKAMATKVGDMFESNTIFRTGPDEKLILKFADGQVVALGPDSVLRIGRYCYLATDLGQSSLTLELMKGEMRVVTGAIGAANREGLHISAGNSMISLLGSRGADFTVAVNPEPQEVGHAVVALGGISVRTPYGRIHEIAAGQYAPWQPGRSLTPPIPFAAAPAVIQAAVADLWTIVLPPNTAVALESTARTVGALAAAARAETAAQEAPRLAGFVQAISNTVSLQNTSGGKVAANVGTTFEAGTTFDTGKDGRAVLKFADGQVVVLGPGSVLVLSQYQFDPANVKTSKLAVELVDGAMRFITGAIQTENRAGINISAGASIVDILNAGPADFTVAVDTKDKEVGVARVTLGEISVHTPYGPIDKINVDQSNLWGPKTPTTPIPVARGLAVVQAAIALQLLGLPDTTPVSVASAAVAAGAAAEANQAQAAASANPNNARLQAAAQAATELANAASQAAIAANEAISAKIVAALLETLGPTAAGPALAQAPAAPAALPPVVPTVPTVTPGAGGGCAVTGCAGSQQ